MAHISSAVKQTSSLGPRCTFSTHFTDSLGLRQSRTQNEEMLNFLQEPVRQRLVIIKHTLAYELLVVCMRTEYLFLRKERVIRISTY